VTPTAGYSGTPLAKKLGIKEGHTVALVGAPDGFEAELEGLPDGVRLRHRAGGRPDIVILFTTTTADLARRFLSLAKSVFPAGSLWVAWPKRASGVATDLDENRLREIGLPHGLVDNKVCAVDGTWSGLRFVWRKENR
jgi:hypothetical protein